MYEKSSREVTLTLPSEREICFTRMFDWPRSLVFEAWTNPEHFREWWGCAGSSMGVCEMDVRVGGKWHFEMHMADGSKHPFHGVYREVLPPERLVYTECYEMPKIGSPEWLTTITFEDVNGRTKLTHRLLHKSVEMRNGHLQAGMETGTVETLNRLDEHLASMGATVQR
jgi:uncharacterized protein YndB with AHSA1/START domain